MMTLEEHAIAFQGRFSVSMGHFCVADSSGAGGGKEMVTRRGGWMALVTSKDVLHPDALKQDIKIKA